MVAIKIQINYFCFYVFLETNKNCNLNITENSANQILTLTWTQNFKENLQIKFLNRKGIICIKISKFRRSYGLIARIRLRKESGCEIDIFHEPNPFTALSAWLPSNRWLALLADDDSEPGGILPLYTSLPCVWTAASIRVFHRWFQRCSSTRNFTDTALRENVSSSFMDQYVPNFGEQ